MKDIWVLSVRTSLPHVCERFVEMKPEVFAFESFEKAREAFRAKIQALAFSQKNKMFNGKGELTQFEEYAKILDDEFDGDEECLSHNVLTQILKALTSAFSGEDVKLKIEDGFYTDWMIAVDVEDNSVNFYGYDDGPCNGYDPLLKTNIFSMENESDYYLYIDDRLGQDDATAELYIDLKKAAVE